MWVSGFREGWIVPFSEKQKKPGVFLSELGPLQGL